MKFILHVVLIATTLAIAPVRFDRDKVLRVKPQDEKQANILKDLANTNEVKVFRRMLNLFLLFSKSFTEKESRAIQSIEKQFDVKEDIPGRHSHAKYNDWDKIEAWTEKMMYKHPEMVFHIKIGSTVVGHRGAGPLYVLKIGKKDERRKAIFMDCGIHAREWVSPAFCQWFAYQLWKNKIMTKLLDQMNFYVLPVFNVDGYIWSRTQYRMWRKNHSKTRNSNCIGTDLNRNFNVSWNDCDLIHHIFCKSEKETKAVADFIQSHLKSIKASSTFHSCSQMLLFPYGFTSQLPPNYEDLVKVAKIGTDALSTRYETHYIYGPTASVIYPASGISLDWAYNLGIKHTFSFELRDRGKFNFLLPESQLKSTCKETMLAVKFIAKYTLNFHTSVTEHL
uniref:Carboxypeptidase A3 n=1 Tax=Oryctolagus cuniculus TaxID=9986 RepID=A0A5F9DF48_RABIT